MEQKVRVTIRLLQSDFSYLKSLFRQQGYNAGIRALLHKFVRISRAKETQYAAGKSTTVSDLQPSAIDFEATRD